jgi:hypothetical protein
LEERENGICLACLIHDQKVLVDQAHGDDWVPTEQDFMFPAYIEGLGGHLHYSTKKSVGEFVRPPPPPDYLDQAIAHNVERYNIANGAKNYKPKRFSRHSLKKGASKHGCDHHMGIRKQMQYLSHSTATMAFSYAHDVALDNLEMWRQLQLTPESAHGIRHREWMKNVDKQLKEQHATMQNCQTLAQAAATFARSTHAIMKELAVKLGADLSNVVMPPMTSTDLQAMQQQIYQPPPLFFAPAPPFYQHQNQFGHPQSQQIDHPQQQQHQQHPQQQHLMGTQSLQAFAPREEKGPGSPRMGSGVARKEPKLDPKEQIVCDHDFCQKTLARSSMKNHHSKRMTPAGGMANPNVDILAGAWMSNGHAHIFSYHEGYEEYENKFFYAPAATLDPKEFRCAKKDCFRRFVGVRDEEDGCQCPPPKKRSRK